MQVLYQLSYSPARDGHDTSAGRAISARYARPRMTEAARTTPDTPQFRYNAALANEIEAKWQDRWEAEHTFWAPNPVGPSPRASTRSPTGTKLYVLDMFPYPSGAGLHVGHPLGYIGTDVYARFKRMSGHNVLHAMGYDAFGLPAEQYAVQTGQHPRVTTEANIANMRRQLRALGLGPRPAPRRRHHRRRLLPLDAVDLPAALRRLVRRRRRTGPARSPSCSPSSRTAPRAESDANPTGCRGTSSTARQRRELVDSYRLAYLDEAPVNWCPALGTVLANEEVTADGRSERGNHPVYRRPLKQWMLRITAYADRLLADLDLLDWPDSIKLMQRNWIGRSVGAEVAFPVEGHDGRRDRRVHDASRHAVRRDLHGARARAPAGRRDRRRDQWPAGLAASMWRGMFGLDKPRRGGRVVPRVRGAEDGARAPGRGPREDRCVHRRVRHEPDQRLERSRSSSPTTC